jgi:hypothetical protein
MRFHKLRIAWSVAWGLAAVLLIVLWVRSYWYLDGVGLRLSTDREVTVFSTYGRLNLTAFADSRAGNFLYRTSHEIYSKQWQKSFPNKPEPNVTQNWRCGITKSGNFVLILPHSFAALLILPLAALPWIRRFTLRTLLVATTLVAVVLGLTVWLR